MTDISRNAGSLDYKPEFDGVRAIAVSAVLLSHFSLGPVLGPIVSRLPLGHMGVQLFFVLSGFLITGILIQCRDMMDRDNATLGGVLKSFYMRRALRIFPIYYATIFALMLFGPAEYSSVVQYQLVFLSNLPQAVYVGPMASGGLIHGASAHFWSLAVEEQFYLFWPLAVLCLPRRAVVILCLALILAAPVFRIFLFAIGFPVQIGYLPAYMDALGAGALLALYRSSWFAPLPPRLLKAIFWISICLAAISLSWSVLGHFYRPFWIIFPFFESILFLYLFAGLLEGKLTAVCAFLKTPVLVAIGKVSYGIYLFHTFVADLVRQYVVDVSSYSELLQTAIAIAACFCAGFFSWHIFERPINNLKRHFPYNSRSAINRGASP